MAARAWTGVYLFYWAGTYQLAVTSRTKTLYLGHPLPDTGSVFAADSIKLRLPTQRLHFRSPRSIDRLAPKIQAMN